MPQPLTLAVHSNAPTPLPEGRFIPQGVYIHMAKIQKKGGEGNRED